MPSAAPPRGGPRRGSGIRGCGFPAARTVRLTSRSSRTRTRRCLPLSRRRAAFPESPRHRREPSASLGKRDREEWADARSRRYDAALVLVPTHRDALLGRVVTLSPTWRVRRTPSRARRRIHRPLGSWFTSAKRITGGPWNSVSPRTRGRGARGFTDEAKGLIQRPGARGCPDDRVARASARRERGGTHIALTLDAGRVRGGVPARRCGPRGGEVGVGRSGLRARAQRCCAPVGDEHQQAIARITARPGERRRKSATDCAPAARAMAEETQHRDEAAQSAVQLQKRGGGIGPIRESRIPNPGQPQRYRCNCVNSVDVFVSNVVVVVVVSTRRRSSACAAAGRLRTSAPA